MLDARVEASGFQVVESVMAGGGGLREFVLPAPVPHVQFMG